MLTHNCSGILVEPVKYLFEKLKKNYAGKTGLVFENIVISNQDGTRKFYRISQAIAETGTVPDYYEYLGTLFKSLLGWHKSDIPNAEDYIVAEKVKCLSYISLIRKHNVKKIDLLVIDAEGFDYEILKQLPESGIKPKMILYEHKCLQKSDQRGCEQFLKKQGYKIRRLRKADDTYCVLKH